METELLRQTEIKRITVAGDGDGAVEIITLSMTVPYRPTISQLKDALEAMSYQVDEIRIGRPCSAFDCTGQAFTSSLDLIDRFIARDSEDLVLVYVLKHYIAFDV